MPLVTTRDVGAEIEAAAIRTPYHGIQTARCRVEVHIADDAPILQAYRAYPALREEMKRNADLTIDERVKFLVADLRRFVMELDQATFNAAKQQELVAEGEKAVKVAVEGMQRVTGAVLEGTWEDFKKTRQDYARYGIKVAFRTTFGGVKIANSIRGSLHGFICPVIGAVAVYSLIRSVIVYGKDVLMLCKQAETVQTEFMKTYESVQKTYQNKVKKAVGLREAGTKLAAVLTPLEPASIAKMEKLFELVQRKYDGLKVRSFAMQKQVNEADAKHRKVMDDLAKGNAVLLKNTPKVARNRPKIEGMVADLEKKARGLEERIEHLREVALPKLFKRIDALHDVLPEYAELVRNLKSRVPKWSTFMQKWIIPFADLEFADSGANLAGKVAIIAGDLATQSQTFEKIMMGLIEHVV